jgi:diphthine-ammonia ligase
MGGYDVVALVSGGKDSVMAAMLAESYGHRVVALGNLLPSDARVEELDSHCFQTVGHNAVEAYGELTGLPLFRRRLRGASRHTEMTYEVGAAECAGDEVEDLRALLAAVVAKMPSVRAVSAGAILSDYQRLRVEAVCSDLGLVSLAYLWQQPQSSVLDLICDSHVHAVLVKVAAMGLDPKKHLGATLADARPTLREIERAFGSHCAGEGGEFETLVLDCPLFKRARLSIEGPPVPEIVITSPDPYAPSGHLAVARAAAVAVAKPAAQRLAPGEVIDAGAGGAPAPRAARRGAAEAAEDARARGVVLGEAETHVFSGTDAAAAHVRARVPATHADDPAAAAAASAEAALRAAAAALGDAFGLSWPDVDYVQLCVRDMNTFAAVNAAYVRVVPTHSPPARACVELPLPEGVPATVEVFASRRRAAPERAPPRRSLHVQSLSCWAPACIGPYAQAATRLGLCHLAGSIGMDPATLSIVGGGEDPALEARRAWRSAAAVARAAGNDLARDAVVATVFVVGSRADPDASAASRAADDALEAVARSDRWVAELDAPGGPRSVEAGVRVPAPVDEKEEKSDEERDGGDRDGGDRDGGDRDGGDRDGGDRDAWTPLVTRVRVPRLPKDAAVEVQPVLLDGAGPGEAPAKTSASHVDDRADDSDDDDDDDDDDARGGASARRRVVSFDAERVGARFVENRWCFARAAVARGDVTAAAVAGAVEALGGALRAAGLGWEHAGTFRGYYAVPERSDASGEEKDILGCFDRLETETELAGWIRIGGESASPCALAPALAVGFGETRDAGLVLEVSAATRARCDGRGRT